jgi:xanthine dehydrogenase accessory factor
MIRTVNKERDLWQFIATILELGQNAMLLVVATSSGSSPGRRGYKMAVSADGELFGSIGGGVMEVNLVEQSRVLLSEPPAGRGPREGIRSGVEDAGGLTQPISEQVHRKNVPDSSGMICSGKQTVIFKMLFPDDLEKARLAVSALEEQRRDILELSPDLIRIGPSGAGTSNTDFIFEKHSDTDFIYRERLGFKNELYIVGGGHCALALCKLMAGMDFHIRLFDDRPNLNTIEKNEFAHDIEIIESYESISDVIPSGENHYVVVMTLGYKSDEAVIKKLLEKEFRYFGVLGSRAKMATLIKSLHEQGYSKERLDRLHTPIGLPINSHTPEEIAVSIAAEIIAVKNSAIE